MNLRKRSAESRANGACWTMLAASWFTAVQAGAAAQDQEERAGDSDSATLGVASVLEAFISPDGTRVVFSADREPDGTLELYSMPLGGRSPIRIGSPLALSGGYSWKIAADGLRVVFLGPDLSSVAIDGSSDPVRLGDPTAPTLDFVISSNGSRVVHRAAPPGLYAGLFSVAIDGSTPPVELVAPNDQGVVEHTYQLSRDGDSVVFASHHEDGSIAKLYCTSVGGGPVVVLDSPPFGIHDFRISPDGGLVVYRCSRGASGNSELYSVPTSGAAVPTRLDVPLVRGGDVLDFEISFDGARVVYLADRGNGRNGLFSVPADGSAVALELAGDVTSSFQIHPAGHLVLHTGDREQDEHFELRGVAIDGSTAPSVLSASMPSPSHVGWFGVAADGTRIVYQAHRDEDHAGQLSELWQVSLADGLRTRLAETGACQDLQLTPDGRRVLYRDEDTLYGLALEGGSAPVALASDLAPEEIHVSPDGSRVLFRSACDHGLGIVRTDGGPSIRLLHASDASGTGGTPQALGAGGGGYRDFSFGNSGVLSPTGEKPESKLWWNDGSWWGSLYVAAAQDYRIHRLDAANQRWVDTGTVLDDRATTNADVLWDGGTQKLYVASHVFTTDAQPTPSGWGRLFRYSYSTASKTYTRDPGFPVDITRGSAEALTIAKDAQGRLWAAWVEASRVMVNHSLASDAAWRTPFVLPASPEAVSVSPDDICSIIAFGGNRVGVMWSNQLDSNVYFAVHRDAEVGTSWQSEEVVLPGLNCSGLCADDHMNLKADAGGRVFAVLKTSVIEPDEPLNLVVVRGPNGGWGSRIFGTKRDNHTRAILLLDEQQGQAHVFATSPTGGGTIYHKSASLADLRFEPGVGTPFIQSSLDAAINDVTSTKQNVTAQSDLLVLACDENTRFYLHNSLELGSVGNPPTIGSFAPTSGPVGTSVTITGTGFAGTTSVRFNGTQAAFSVVSSTQLRATVPAGATSGQISVFTPNGTATSAASFQVTRPPVIDSFLPPTGLVLTPVTITGEFFTGATSVKFNGKSAQFVVLSSSAIVTAVPFGATTGKISVTTSSGAGTSATSFVVIGL